VIEVKVKWEEKMAAVRKSIETATFKNLRAAGFQIMRTAQASLRKEAGPSRPGEPPHTHRGYQLARAIQYEAEGEDHVIIGPQFSKVNLVGKAHEFGGEFRGEEYPARPFMEPALESNLDRLASGWSGSVFE
jgi:hypothetical protein